MARAAAPGSAAGSAWSRADVGPWPAPRSRRLVIGHGGEWTGGLATTVETSQARPAISGPVHRRRAVRLPPIAALMLCHGRCSPRPRPALRAASSRCPPLSPPRCARTCAPTRPARPGCCSPPPRERAQPGELPAADLAAADPVRSRPTPETARPPAAPSTPPSPQPEPAASRQQRVDFADGKVDQPRARHRQHATFSQVTGHARVRRQGLEPRTRGLRARCSAIGSALAMPVCAGPCGLQLESVPGCAGC
jgi:hypothetical protein